MPTPRQLARDFEAGVLSREQFQAAMSLHANEILEEMAVASRNPLAAYLERLRNQRAANRLVKKYSESELRSALVAVSESPDSPMASLLWNAGHWDVPLSCFLRMGVEPVFRIVDFGRESGRRLLIAEFGSAGRGKADRWRWLLERNLRGDFQVVHSEIR